MAFLRTQPRSPYFMAIFSDETGRKVERSTKVAIDSPRGRARAQAVADEWEAAAKSARAGELTAAAAMKTLAGLVAKSSGEKVTDDTVAEYCAAWLAAKKGKIASSSLARYQPTLARFLESLGPRARKSIRGVTPGDVEKFQAALKAAGQSAGTVNYGVKVLRILFKPAHQRGKIPINPAAGVELLDDDAMERQPWSIDQIQRLLAVANDEWRGMILFGALAGLRLADAASITWEMIDLENGVLTLLPMKTAKRRKGVPMQTALHPAILQWLALRPADPARQMVHYATIAKAGVWEARKKGPPVFPTLRGTPTGAHGGLSNAFRRIMVLAGLDAAPIRSARPGGRAFHALTFHSLRHSFVSELLNREVPADVRMMLAGHSSDRAHSRYSHLSLETQRAAVTAHPGFLKDDIG